MKSRITSLTFLIAVSACFFSQISAAQSSGNNLANVATASGSARYGNAPYFLNDGLISATSGGTRTGGNRPPRRLSNQWVQYEWEQPVTVNGVAVYWWNSGNTVRLPHAYRIKYWDGNDFIPVKNVSGLGLENNQYNLTSFDPVQTTRLRLEADSAERFPGTLLEWQVFQAENSPNHPPVSIAGVDRSVIMGGKTYLSGNTRSVTPVTKITWKKKSGPGNVVFEKPGELMTKATFSSIGEYVLSGKPVVPSIVNGYAVINRTWKAGDRIDLELPMEIQTVTADERIAADRGRVALKYGPLVYNSEKADQPDIDKYIGTGPLSLEWKKDLLGGIMVINGKWSDGSPLVAIPNYARNNRNTVKSTDKPERPNPADGSNVWIKKQL